MNTQKNPTAGTRIKPPSRRLSENRKITWQPPSNPDAPETTIYVTIGYHEDGLTPLEIFYDSGYRSGSEREAEVSDVCIVLSVFLQHSDIDLNGFTKSVSQITDLRSGEEAHGSLIGVLLDELQKPPRWAKILKAAQDSEHQRKQSADPTAEGRTDA